MTGTGSGFRGSWLWSQLLVAGALVSAQTPPPDPYRVAEHYVKLVLAVGQHDADYVDAFYGPAEWRKEAEAAKKPLAAIDAQAAALETRARRSRRSRRRRKADAELWALRRQYLTRQLAALRSRVAMLQGKKLTFDEESLALYDAVAPTKPEAEFEAVLEAARGEAARRGPLIDRYDRFKQAFVIPTARLDRVFQEAIRGCRGRMPSVELPPNERFTVEYVTGKSWSGYNWYQGDFKSLIQVNTDLPIYIDRAIDLACHEGYPGHHVYNVLLEKNLVKDRGWIEYTVYPLFSPQSLIAEGTANYGIEVAFPRADRLRFESDVLFPLAGLDPNRVAGVLRPCSSSSIGCRTPATRRRAAISTARSIAPAPWRGSSGTRCTRRPRAEQRVKFIEQYRSYVINYNLGKDLVRAYIEQKAGRDTTPLRRWREFAALLSSPRLPSGLK